MFHKISFFLQDYHSLYIFTSLTQNSQKLFRNILVFFFVFFFCEVDPNWDNRTQAPWPIALNFLVTP